MGAPRVEQLGWRTGSEAGAWPGLLQLIPNERELGALLAPDPFEFLRALLHVHKSAALSAALGPGGFAHDLALALGAFSDSALRALSPTGLLVAMCFSSQ